MLYFFPKFALLVKMHFPPLRNFHFKMIVFFLFLDGHSWIAAEGEQVKFKSLLLFVIFTL